jgi:Dyp-type peroxidase family
MTNVENTKRDIQGFITSGFGHTYQAAYVFLRVENVEQAKQWLKDTIPVVMTAESWRPDTPPGTPPEEKPAKNYPSRMLNLAFSFEGLAAFNLSEASLNSFPPEIQQGIAAEVRSLRLGDTEASDPQNWQVGGPSNTPFHILAILHADVEPGVDADIKQFVEEFVNGLKGLDVTHLEWGYRRTDDKEHFGFKDGIAQPKIRGINFYDRDGKSLENPAETGEFILGHLSEYGLFPTVPVVPRSEDPEDILPTLNNPRALYPLYTEGDLKDLGKNGTYVVYRKLRQHVVTFWQFLAAEAQRIDGRVSTSRMLWLAAKMVGRSPAGDPLVSHPEQLKHQDDFLYAEQDPEGLFCPFGSHLRRSNPRDMLLPGTPKAALEAVSRHRIMRRGRVYGEPLFDLSLLDGVPDDAKLQFLLTLTEDDTDRGLHFLCVNTNIQRQFEFIQDNWTNNPDFNKLYQNKDPIIGDNAHSQQAPSYMTIPQTPVRYRTQALPRFVTVLGGAYLFMPSLTALRFLAH